MIVNEGDTVQVDGYWKQNIEGAVGIVIKADYERERSLVDTDKKIFWIGNDYLLKVKEFYE
jgi:hypothetical protein